MIVVRAALFLPDVIDERGASLLPGILKYLLTPCDTSYTLTILVHLRQGKILIRSVYGL